MRLLACLLLFLAAAAAVVGLVHQWQAAEEARLQAALAREQQARAQQLLAQQAAAALEQDTDRHGRADAEAEQLRGQLAAALERIEGLERDLRAEIQRRKEVDGLIERTATMLREERERHNREIWEDKQFMPEGVRNAVATANELFREDQCPEFRFLKAMSIEDRVLHKVQALDRDATSLAPILYVAERATLVVDRAKSTLTLTLMDGYVRGPDGRETLTGAGKALVFPDVDGRRWEARLPFLVRAEGEYPVPKVELPKPRMDPRQRDGWLKRINALLEKAGTEERLKLETFRNLESGRFQEALLLGYDSRKRLAMSAEAGRLWFHVADAAGYVELRMEAGVLRKRGGETPIPQEGYRIRLPGVKPGEAIQGMLGMVKRQ